MIVCIGTKIIVNLIFFQEEILSSKVKKLRKQKKYRGDSTLPPEFDINIPKPRFVFCSVNFFLSIRL